MSCVILNSSVEPQYNAHNLPVDTSIFKPGTLDFMNYSEL